MKTVEARVNGLILEHKTQQNIVILRETEGERILPIWIGSGEAQAIRRILSEEAFPRPLTHDLIHIVIEGLKAKITRVVIADLRENTFYASITISVNGSEMEIDSRPSDAIALAVRTSAPIFAADDVIDESSIEFEHEVEDTEEVVEKFKDFLDQVTPEDFAKGEE